MKFLATTAVMLLRSEFGQCLASPVSSGVDALDWWLHYRPLLALTGQARGLSGGMKKRSY